MYVIKRGFALLFRYLGTATIPEAFCRMHEMSTGEIEILGRREVPFSRHEMCTHRALKWMPAVRRSFQRRSFRLDEPYLTEVGKLFGWSPSQPRTRVV
jgi:hypothetical protein